MALGLITLKNCHTNKEDSCIFFYKNPLCLSFEIKKSKYKNVSMCIKKPKFSVNIYNFSPFASVSSSYWYTFNYDFELLRIKIYFCNGRVFLLDFIFFKHGGNSDIV